MLTEPNTSCVFYLFFDRFKFLSHLRCATTEEDFNIIMFAQAVCSLVVLERILVLAVFM
jgi:hypothetical protein